MSELSPQARSIIDAARHADGPRPADKERIRAAVFGQVGLAVPASAQSGSGGGTPGPGSLMNASAGSTGLTVAAKVLIGVAIIGGIGGYVIARSVARSPEQPAAVEISSAPTAVAPTAATRSPSSEPAAIGLERSSGENAAEPAGRDDDALDPDAEELQFAPVAVASRRRAKSTRGSRSSAERNPPERQAPAAKSERPNGANSEAAKDEGTDPLAALRREQKLISAAKHALDAEDAAGAMNLLRRHGEQFRGGVLAQERDALRVVALCALGQTERGIAEKGQFLRKWPRSPQASTVRRACTE